MHKKTCAIYIMTCCSFVFLFPPESISQGPRERSDLDDKVMAFLERRQGSWRDLNVPASDGKLLHDLIVKNRYTKAL